MHTSTLRSIHEAAGARLSGGDTPTVLTYGDVPGEYRAGMEDALLLDETARGAVTVSGEDAASFLHKITSCDVHPVQVDQGCPGLLLDSKGKVRHQFHLCRTAEDSFELSVSPGQAKPLLQALDNYLFSEAVEITEATDLHAPLELVGPRAGSILGNVLGEVPQAWLNHSEVIDAGDLHARATHLELAGSAGWRIDGGPGAAQKLWRSLVSSGAVPGGLVAVDSLRVEAGRAMWGRDIDDMVYPQEARLEHAFSLEKGCYIGQEVVAKIDTYGGLNKCIFGLSVDTDDPVSPGTRLWREVDGEWRDLGMVTSWAYSFALEGGMVLAYIKRRHQEAGTIFRVGDGPLQATILELPIRKEALPLTGGPKA